MSRIKVIFLCIDMEIVLEHHYRIETHKRNASERI